MLSQVGSLLAGGLGQMFTNGPFGALFSLAVCVTWLLLRLQGSEVACHLFHGVKGRNSMTNNPAKLSAWCSLLEGRSPLGPLGPEHGVWTVSTLCCEARLHGFWWQPLLISSGARCSQQWNGDSRHAGSCW